MLRHAQNNGSSIATFWYFVFELMMKNNNPIGTLYCLYDFWMLLVELCVFSLRSRGNFEKLFKYIIGNFSTFL